MTTIQQVFRSIGNDGARINARLELERRAHDDAILEELTRHLPPVRPTRIVRAA